MNKANLHLWSGLLRNGWINNIIYDLNGMMNMSELNINHSIEKTGPIPDVICSSSSDSQLNIDLHSVIWWTPDILVRLKCVIDLAKEYQIKVSIRTPEKSDVNEYARRIGLYNGTLINKEAYQHSYSKHDSDHFFPLFKIENDHNDRLEEKCLNLIKRNLKIRPFDLANHFSEIADNVYFHSGRKENTGWGYAQAQAYSDGRVQIAVSDIGIGFLGSYERTQQIRDRSEMDIIIDSFEELESSLNNQTDINHRGLGLYGVYEYIKEQSGQIEVWSGKSYMKINGKDEPIKKSLSYKVVGVLFKMSLYLKNP